MSSKCYSGFTLIEVAVCGAVMSFSLLTALAIIPRGLVLQNQARMRTVASATMVYLASDSFGKGIQAGMDAVSLPGSIKWIWPVARTDDSTIPVSSCYRLAGLSSGSINDGRLERRIIFTPRKISSTSYTTEWTAWLLNKDVTKAPTTATYLATFVEANIAWNVN